jgi:hypothetical protein
VLHEIKARADAGLRCRFPEARLGYAADKLTGEYKFASGIIHAPSETHNPASMKG